MSPAGPAIARGPEKWSDIGLLLPPMDSPGQSAACSSSGFRAGCWSASCGGRVVEHPLECLVHVLSLLDLRNRKTAQRVEVRGRRGLYLLDDLLDLGTGPLQVLIISGVVFANFLDQATSPMPRVLRPPRCARIQSTKCCMPTTSIGIVDVWVPVGLEARGKHELPTVIEDHQPRVPQTGLLYVLRVGFLQHPAESESTPRAPPPRVPA